MKEPGTRKLLALDQRDWSIRDLITTACRLMERQANGNLDTIRFQINAHLLPGHHLSLTP